LGKQRVCRYPNELFTGLVDSLRAFLDGVVSGKDRAEYGDDRWRRCRHEQRSQGTMIKAELGGKGKRLIPTCTLGSREQNLFLHANVFEQAATKFSVRGPVDLPSRSESALQESIEPCMIVRKKTAESSRHQIVPH
jgi:hypothetical protein